MISAAIQVLQFVQDHHNLTVSCRRCPSRGGQQIGYIDVQIAGISDSGFRVDIKRQFRIAVGQLDAAQEALQNPKGTLHFHGQPPHPIEIEQNGPQMRAKKLT